MESPTSARSHNIFSYNDCKQQQRAPANNKLNKECVPIFQYRFVLDNKPLVNNKTNAAKIYPLRIQEYTN